MNNRDTAREAARDTAATARRASAVVANAERLTKCMLDEASEVEAQSVLLLARRIESRVRDAAEDAIDKANALQEQL